MDRRDFLRTAAVVAAACGLEPGRVAARLLPDPKRLSWLSQRDAGKEGAWTLTEVEGEVPAGLHGTLYRVAPGQTVNHGVRLRHLFDGDAFAMGFSFREGRVDFRGRFIPLPERLEEQEAGRMLYSEVGTVAPEPTEPFPLPVPVAVRTKNQPSVNVIHWDGRLLGLSEGGVPTAFSPEDFSFQERWTFHGALPPVFQGFTAHPRFDPDTGAGYGFGMRYAADLSADLVVWRMEADGDLTRIFEWDLERQWMVHDMLMAGDFLVFLIGSAAFRFEDLFTGGRAVTDVLRFQEDEPVRVLVIRKDGSGAPRWMSLPPAVVFHHGNAFVRDGEIVLDTFLFPDGGVLEVLAAWAKDQVPGIRLATMQRMVLDLEKGEVAGRSAFAQGEEFPRFDLRRAGREARWLYTLASADPENPFAGTHLVRHDLEAGRALQVAAGRGRALGEPIFVPRPESEAEDAGWLLVLGYDARRDRTFLEIRDAASLELAGRVWTPDHYPLGFHGNFTSDAFVTT